MISYRNSSKVSKNVVFCLLMAVLSACVQSQKPTETQETAESAESTECAAEQSLTTEEIKTLIAFIPDHGLENSPKEAFTEEYYSLLTEAWAIPTDNPGGIGNEEWLYYFISGNSEGFDYIDITSSSIDGNNATVLFECRYGGSSERDMHRLNLVETENGWLIADYDNTLEQLAEYIKGQRDFFRSDEWPATLQNNEYLTAEDRTAAQEEVLNYFKKYPEDRN